jgi:tRNA-specific 2-thiouridylase
MQRGDFLDAQCTVIGQHKGIIHYTVGQRKGPGKAFGKSVYVVGKDARKNTVTLGGESDLYGKRLVAADVNLIAMDTLEFPLNVTAKTRYKMQEAKAKMYLLGKDRVLVEFDSPQRVSTPGQAVVFCCGDVVIGGGTITSV